MSESSSIALIKLISTVRTDDSLLDNNFESPKLYFTGIKYAGSGKGWITATSCLSNKFPDQFKSPIVKQGFPDSDYRSVQSCIIPWSENYSTAFQKKWRVQAYESGIALIISSVTSY
jgi:hypothetical protein